MLAGLLGGRDVANREIGRHTGNLHADGGKAGGDRPAVPAERGERAEVSPLLVRRKECTFTTGEQPVTTCKQLPCLELSAGGLFANSRVQADQHRAGGWYISTAHGQLAQGLWRAQ